MAKRSTEEVEAELFAKLFELMHELKQTPDGIQLYTRIAGGYHERSAIQGSVNRAFFEYTITLLKQYTKKSKIDPATRMRADQILRFVITYLEAYHAELPAWRPVQASIPGIDNPPHNLLRARKSFEQQVASMLWATRNELPKHAHGYPPPAPKKPAGSPVMAPPAPISAAPISSAGPSVSSLVLHSAYSDLKKQRDGLAARISSAIGQNLDFVAQLKFLQQVLQQKDVPDSGQLHELMSDGTDELIVSYRELGDNLHQAKDTLEAIQAHEQQIQSEVNKILLTTLTDESSIIPNRAAFMHRLEGEIDRAKRHGNSLALAIIEPDIIHGASAGPGASEAIVRIYASSVLSRFRAYDVVARYSDKEFAILLPNAGEQQTLSALRNAQQHAATTFYQHNGRRLTPPTFSSGVAWYLHDEPADRFLARADNALQNARRSGPSWIETALSA